MTTGQEPRVACLAVWQYWCCLGGKKSSASDLKLVRSGKILLFLTWKSTWFQISIETRKHNLLWSTRKIRGAIYAIIKGFLVLVVVRWLFTGTFQLAMYSDVLAAVIKLWYLDAFCSYHPLQVRSSLCRTHKHKEDVWSQSKSLKAASVSATQRYCDPMRLHWSYPLHSAAQSKVLTQAMIQPSFQSLSCPLLSEFPHSLWTDIKFLHSICS